MLIIKGFLIKVSESTCRKCHHYLQQFLVMVILHLAIIIENHRCSLFCGIRFPLGQPFSIGIARTGKVQPRTAHLFAQSLCFSAAPGHGSMAHYIVEHKRESPCSACCGTCRPSRAIPTRTYTYRPERLAAQLSV